MAQSILETMEEHGISKEKVIGGLIMIFGIVMFVAGVYLGEYVQYGKDKDHIAWYGDNCLCTENYIVPNLLPQLSEEFRINVSGG